MNIESKTIPTTTKTTEASTTSSSTATATKDNATTFKDELETVKAQENQNPQANDATETKNSETNSTNNLSQQVEKDKLATEKDNVSENFNNIRFLDPLNELNSKIATLNEIKNGSNQKIQGADATSKVDTKTGDYCQTIKMDSHDATFFLNLVQNQQMSAQANQTINQGNANTNFTDIKSEATQSSIQVSATLLNALNDSAKTGKSFRIDFDNDIAVIMKVDKEGVLSANFIPGSAAVEQYLKNNIASLRQSFDEQNLPYNQLSYSNQQKQKKEEQQQNNNNKENGHE